MCGICGFTGGQNTKLIQQMISQLAHRGPDDTGFVTLPHFPLDWEGVPGEGSTSLPSSLSNGVSSNNIGVSLGHRRLSIIDLSPAGRQPMSNADGSIWITYNGEIYNYQEIRQVLSKKGYQFRTNTDTEVIIYAYQEWGENCLERFRGMFAFGLWDGRKNLLFLARDRIGIKPLYYTVLSDGNIAFASEIKALLLNKSVSPQLDKQALHDYLTYLYIPPPRTIFAGICKLPPAHYLLWQDGQMQIKRYWKLEFKDLKLSEQEYQEQLLEVLRESVQLRMISDVPLGVFLSGGLDSSTIVAFMSEASTSPVKTFSIGFGKGEELYDELPYARIVSEHFQTEHTELQVTPKAAELLPEIVSHFDEPFGNPTALLTYLLSQLTREHVTVALGGDGGDEAFAGYPRYKGVALAEYYRRLPKIFQKGLFQPIANILPESTHGRHIFRRIHEFVDQAGLDPIEMYSSWVTYYSEEMKQALYTDDFRVSIDGYDSYNFLRGLFEEAEGQEFLDRVNYVDLHSFLPCNLLEYTDKMSMAHALEVRTPYTDHKLLEFLATMPYSLKLRGRRSKYILRKVMTRYLPEEILKRKKLGFNPPMGIWLSRDLRELTYKLLSPERIRKRGYFQHTKIQEMLAQHYSGRRDFSLHIWALLVLEVWHQLYLD